MFGKYVWNCVHFPNYAPQATRSVVLWAENARF